MAKVLQVTLLFLMTSMLLGLLFIRIQKEKQASFLLSILYGCIFMMALFDVLVIPMTILGQSLTRLTQIWAGLIGCFAIISAFIAKSQLALMVKTLPAKCKKLTPLNAILLILIIVQMFICYRYIFLHENDAYYVGMTSTTLTTDQLLSYSPYTGNSIDWINYKTHLIASLPIYWAMLAKIVGVSGAFMCHSIVPVLFIPIGYILYREIGFFLFKQKHDQVNLFLLLICIGNFFIGNSYNFSYEMLTTSVWQGGTFLYSIVLPGIFYFTFKFLKNRSRFDLIMVFMMLVIGSMTVPKSGIVLSGLTFIILGVSFMIERMMIKRKRIDAGINI